MSSSEAERQQLEKYLEHDITFDDLTSGDLSAVREDAIKKFRETRDSDQVSLIIKAFMGLLTSKNLRITRSSQ